MKETNYIPESGIRKPKKLLFDMISDFNQAHNLGYRLAIRNIKGLYRQSILGYAWSIIPPFVTALVWIFLKNNNVVEINDPGVPYPVFVFVGTLLWQAFSESVQAPLKGVTLGKSMLVKINFPRESLILSGIYESIYNAVIKIVLIIIVLFYFQYVPPLTAIFGIFGFISLMILGNTIGMLLTPVGILYKDIQQGIILILQLAIYLTPVIYPEPKEGMVSKIMQYNPVAPLLTTARNIILGIELENLNEFILFTIIYFLIFIIGLLFYRLVMPIIIERVGN